MKVVSFNQTWPFNLQEGQERQARDVGRRAFNGGYGIDEVTDILPPDSPDYLVQAFEDGWKQREKVIRGMGRGDFSSQ